MILEIQLCLAFVHFVHGNDLDIIVKLDPKQIVDTLQSQTSLKYLTKLAELFAKTAAKIFINEIKKKEHLIKEDSVVSDSKTNRVHKPMHVNQYILNEEKAYKLLEEPLPDGDNLGWHSTELSDEEERKEKNKAAPLYGLAKVNGIYVL
ncbi:unnamed protein product [Euphydryas editha]|uniref:Uncharacterized protein n=1 Tax=Euphydryas editha TaxID=104508 RepID=A0AAU9VA18_EUPED|nr:unnamed protein product [Euphydryas editha]